MSLRALTEKGLLSHLVIPILLAVGLFFALFLSLAGYGDFSEKLLFVIVVVGSIPMFVRIFQSIRQGVFGVDIIAACAIVASVLLGEYVAGAIIIIMLSGGEALEDFALSRAKRHLESLLSRAPTIAHKRVDDALVDVRADEVQPDDIVLVKTGEIVPVDGILEDEEATLDESALTGEALPAEKHRYMHISSGVLNMGGVFALRAIHTSDESAYGRIIALVKQASSSRPPMVRLADRYAVWFNIFTLMMAAGAWAYYSDPSRALAVLVVASPCPLILAVPIAVMSAISAAAKKGVVVKDGGVLERLARVKAFVFDKTGTLTFGIPQVLEVVGLGDVPKEEVLRDAASVEQLSNHVLAVAVVGEAQRQNIRTEYPTSFSEKIGNGVQGVVFGNDVVVGKDEYLREMGVVMSDNAMLIVRKCREQGQMAVFVARKRTIIGAFLLGDVVREGAKKVVEDLRQNGVQHVALLTGDVRKNAERVAHELKVSQVCAECLPEMKVEEVQRIRKEYGMVAMVGDGINDAPALAVADVGIAMTSRGETAATDAADVVITIDAVERARDVYFIAQNMLRIAMQSIVFGMGASVVLMVFAFFGYIQPAFGAILQEVVDVVVILNALRVLKPMK
jgi:heavy metal translocating P-type ATPase